MSPSPDEFQGQTPPGAAPGGEAAEEPEMLELLRLAGVSHVAQLPLDVEREIQGFLRRAGRPIVDRLAAGLADRDPMTRMKVATYLGQIADPSCVPALVRCLHDHDPRVRLLAVVSLRDCGEVSAIDPLLAMLEDDDARVRGAAADAFSCLTNRAHETNAFASPAERATETERLRRWWAEHRELSRDELLAAGFRARGHDVPALDAAGAAGLIAALGDRVAFVQKNAQMVLGRLSGENRSLEDELRDLDPDGERDYETTRAEAVENLRRFYRDSITRPRP